METQNLFFFEEDEEMEMDTDIYNADDDDDSFNAGELAFVRYGEAA